MTATPSQEKAESAPKTGHRPGRNPDEPRNNTVCFMVSKSEQAAIDALSVCMNRRRSAILTEIVTRFMAAVESPRGTVKRTALLDLLEDCQEQVSARRDLFDSFKRKD